MRARKEGCSRGTTTLNEKGDWFSSASKRCTVYEGVELVLANDFCLIVASDMEIIHPDPNSLNDSQNISENVSQSPPPITQNCCYKCEEPLDGFFCHQCTCKSCGKGAHYGYNCPPQVLIISKLEPCNIQTIVIGPHWKTLPKCFDQSDKTDFGR
ncbi:hypothetical protein Tco_0032849 [Tanacetum coccineum]